MKDFNYYLDTIGEIGFVEEMVHSLVYASGLPKGHPGEVVLFESGDLGQVLSLSRDQIEVLLLTNTHIQVGSKLVRTGEHLQVPVGMGLLGRTIDPLGRAVDKLKPIAFQELRSVDVVPPKIVERLEVAKPLETGVSLVDLVVPLGKGQRELIIGDRKTGKTDFLLQTLTTQAILGTICIYAQIGQKRGDIATLTQFFEENSLIEKTIQVASNSSDPSGIIFLTPYTAMTLAEYFKEQGMDVLLILDDMTTHARNYREISILARRFPGRGSYPGDIFYVHSRLIERAGNFKKGSITLLPVAESLLGDLSGYIQTNLMAMTDGHIFFDIELYNEGKRPPVNPFLSVTRVGHQTQTPLLRDISRELSSFLVKYERMKEFIHFGAEVGEEARKVLSLGTKVDLFFNQGTLVNVAIPLNLVILSGLWAGIWNETKDTDLRFEIEQLVLSYQTKEPFKKEVDSLVLTSVTFEELVTYIRRNNHFLLSVITRQ